MNTTVKAPWYYWAVSIVGLLWNSFGGYDYFQTRQRNTEYLAQVGDAQVLLAWIDSFPMWTQVCWGLGVWGSVLGSVLMLMRSRHAATAFAVSFVAALGSFGYQWMNEAPASLDTTANKVIPFVILAIVAFLWWFSRRSTAQGIQK